MLGLDSYKPKDNKLVVFNPQVDPVNPPNWSNVSKPISDVQADKSTAIAITGATEVLDSSVKAADMLTKESIKQDTYEGVDRLRDAYTDGLKTVRNMQIAGTQTPGSLLPDGGDGGGDAPPGLSNGLDRVKQIGTALAQNGNKINDTLYTGALNSMAKQLRNSYPGYRDYIDEQIKSVSGVDPANAFMKNLMEDINRNQEANKTERNATLGMIRDLSKEGFHDANGVSAASMGALYKAGRIDETQFNGWVNDAMKLRYDIKAKADSRADRQAGEQDASKDAVKDAGDLATKTINQGWKTFTIGKGTDTFEKMANYIRDNAGNQNVTDERSRAIGQQMLALRNGMWTSAWQAATEAGLLSKGGENADAIRKSLDARFATMDLAIKSVTDGDWGSAYSHMQFNKAITEDSKNLLYNAPDETVRRYNRMVGAVNSISPQAASQFFNSSVLGGVPKGESDYLKTMKLELLTQPDEQQGSLVGAKQQIEKMKAKGATSPKTYSDFIDTVNFITDKNWNMENRVNLARGFFDPVKNAGLLSDENFKKDYTDQNGRQVPGKYSVFNKLAAPAVSNSIKEIGQQRPDVSTDYRVMMEREFGEQLFSRELKDLGQDNANQSSNRGYKIGYVSQPGQVARFAITDNNGRELTDTEALALRAPVPAKNRLNSGIAGMYNVYGATGSAEPNTDILNTMYKYGYQQAGPNRDLNQGWTGEASDVPRMIWNSLVASQQDRLRKTGEAMRKNQ